MHDCIELSNDKIIEKDKKNNSVEIFYFVIEKAFDNIRDEGQLRNLVRYLQETY